MIRHRTSSNKISSKLKISSRISVFRANKNKWYSVCFEIIFSGGKKYSGSTSFFFSFTLSHCFYFS